MKRILWIIFALLITTQGISQTFTPPAYADVDYNHRNYVNQVFGALEPNRVTTGLLMDYAVDFTEPKIYNGIVLHDSTLMEQGIYSELYKTLFTSRFNGSVAGMRHPAIHDSLCFKARQREVVTLSGLMFKYNSIQLNANTTGKMQVVNGQLKDVYANGA